MRLYFSYSLLEHSMTTKRVLVIVPHPDDAEYHAGGLIAKCIAEGCEVHYVTATDGRCGSYDHPPLVLADLRRQEAIEAAKFMGASVEFLGYADFELDHTAPEVLREQLVRKIREYKPAVVIAEDAFQKDQVHPDHRYLAMAASDAINFAQLPNVFPAHLAEGLEPHYIIEKYLYTEEPGRINRVIDVTEFVEKKLQAMQRHQSQVEFLVADVLMQAETAGLSAEVMPAGMDGDPFNLLAFAMTMQMSEIGKTAGVQYGEGYRYSRFHPEIEALLQANHS